MNPLVFLDCARMGIDPNFNESRVSPLQEPLKAVPQPAKKHDDFAHRPWLFCRDIGLDRVQNELAAAPICGNAIVAIGSGFAPFDIAAVRGTLAGKQAQSIQHIILVDCSTRIQALWNKFLPMIQMFTDPNMLINLFRMALTDPRAYTPWYAGDKVLTPAQCALEELELLSAVNNALNEGAAVAPNAAMKAQSLKLCRDAMQGIDPWVQAEMKREIAELEALAPGAMPAGFVLQKNNNSWLSDKARYDRIRKMHITFVRMDLFDEKAVGKLREILDKQGITIDTLYLSNVGDFAKDQGEGAQKAFAAAKRILRARTFAWVVEAAFQEKPVQLLVDGKVMTRFLRKISMIKSISRELVVKGRVSELAPTLFPGNGPAIAAEINSFLFPTG